jgi:hypothetical protein
VAIWRGFLGALTGLARRGIEAGVRLLTDVLRLGRPAPTPELGEEVRAVQETIVTLPEREQLEFLAQAGMVEAQYIIPSMWGPRPETMIADPGRLPRGPFNWGPHKAAATFRIEFTHPLVGERMERYVTVKFSEPMSIGSLAGWGIAAMKDSALLGMEPGDVVWELDAISASIEG